MYNKISLTKKMGIEFTLFKFEGGKFDYVMEQSGSHLHKYNFNYNENLTIPSIGIAGMRQGSMRFITETGWEYCDTTTGLVTTKFVQPYYFLMLEEDSIYYCLFPHDPYYYWNREEVFLSEGETLNITVNSDRKKHIFVFHGELETNGKTFRDESIMRLREGNRYTITANENSRFTVIEKSDRLLQDMINNREY